MSNKSPEKLDGVFDAPSGEKAAVKNEKPARPPKIRTSFSRETKVGLAVIAALLVILVVVLVVRLRGDGDDTVAQSTAADAKQAKQSEKAVKKTTPASSPKVLSANSGTSTNSQYWSGGSGQVSGGAAASKSVYGGSQYAPLNSAAQQPDQRQDYLPQTTTQPPTQTGAGFYGPQGNVGDTSVGANPLRPNSGNPQHFDSGKAAQDSAAPGAPFDPFAARPPLGATGSLPATATDENDVAAATTTQSGPALDNSLDNASGTSFTDSADSKLSSNVRHDRATGQSQAPLFTGGAATGPKTLGQGEAVTKASGSSPARASKGKTDLDEAPPFVPDAAPSIGGAGTLAGASSGNDGDDDKRDPRSTTDDFNDRGSPLKSAETFDTPKRRPDQSTAGRDSSRKDVFSSTSRSARGPASIDDEPRVTEHGDAPAPINPNTFSDADETYAVRSNDTYWTIAKNKYGSGAYFKALYEHNRRRLQGAESLAPGMQLILPDEANLHRLYPTLCPPSQQLASATGATRASAQLDANQRTYVVKQGDTLFEVARRELGHGKRSGEIYQLNRDVIGPPSRPLAPGTRLVLPDGAAENAN